jgi:hypothetical protein
VLIARRAYNPLSLPGVVATFLGARTALVSTRPSSVPDRIPDSITMVEHYYNSLGEFSPELLFSAWFWAKQVHGSRQDAFACV